MPAFKTRRILLATGGARPGSGTNYTDFSTTGRETMVGTARVFKDLWLPATAFYGIEPNGFANAFNATATAAACTPSVRPFAMAFGSAAGSTVSMPTLAASTAADVDSRAAAMFFAPSDADTAGSVTATLYYTTKLAMATAGSMQVFRLNYTYIGSAGSAPGGVSGSILYGASMATVGNGLVEAQALGSLPSFNAAASPVVGLQLTLEQSNACGMAGSPEESIFGLRLRYVANALGAVTLSTT